MAQLVAADAGAADAGAAGAAGAADAGGVATAARAAADAGAIGDRLAQIGRHLADLGQTLERDAAAGPYASVAASVAAFGRYVERSARWQTLQGVAQRRDAAAEDDEPQEVADTPQEAAERRRAIPDVGGSYHLGNGRLVYADAPLKGAERTLLGVVLTCAECGEVFGPVRSEEAAAVSVAAHLLRRHDAVVDVQCNRDGCRRLMRSSGLCTKHNAERKQERRKAYARTVGGQTRSYRRRDENGEWCGHDGCDRPAHSVGLCAEHARADRRARAREAYARSKGGQVRSYRRRLDEHDEQGGAQ